MMMNHINLVNITEATRIMWTRRLLAKAGLITVELPKFITPGRKFADQLQPKGKETRWQIFCQVLEAFSLLAALHDVRDEGCVPFAKGFAVPWCWEVFRRHGWDVDERSRAEKQIYDILRSRSEGRTAAVPEAGIGQEGRRAQGVHEDLPVDQEGVSSAAPTQASGDSCVRRLACAFQVARALGGGIER